MRNGTRGRLKPGSGKKSVTAALRGGREEKGQERKVEKERKGNGVRGSNVSYFPRSVAKRLISRGTFSSALTTVQLGRTMVLSGAGSPRESASTILPIHAELLTVLPLRSCGCPSTTRHQPYYDNVADALDFLP